MAASGFARLGRVGAHDVPSRRVTFALALMLFSVTVAIAQASGTPRTGHVQLPSRHRPLRADSLDPARPVIGISGGAAGWGDASTAPRLDGIVTETSTHWLRELIRADLVAHGAAGKPVWITEVGYSTCQNRAVCVSEDVQAQDLRTVFSYVHGRWRQFVKAVFVYRFDDLGGCIDDPEGYYGLVHQDGTPKPALSVFRAQVHLDGA